MAISLYGSMIYIRPWIDKNLREMEIKQKFSSRKIFLAAFSGALLHITIDAMHHPYMQPFMPLDIRPLFGLASTFELRAVTFAMLLLSFPVYIIHVSDRYDFRLGKISGKKLQDFSNFLQNRLHEILISLRHTNHTRNEDQKTGESSEE